MCICSSARTLPCMHAHNCTHVHIRAHTRIRSYIPRTYTYTHIQTKTHQNITEVRLRRRRRRCRRRWERYKNSTASALDASSPGHADTSLHRHGCHCERPGPGGAVRCSCFPTNDGDVADPQRCLQTVFLAPDLADWVSCARRQLGEQDQLWSPRVDYSEHRTTHRSCAHGQWLEAGCFGRSERFKTGHPVFPRYAQDLSDT